jgi:PIN domain nuclease of toxin-antitoxin system
MMGNFSLIIDTHILLWFLLKPEKLMASVRQELSEGEHILYFSVLSIWEIAIKTALKKPDFDVDALVVRNQLLKSGWQEIPFVGLHAIAVRNLHHAHGDPFDQGLIAQAIEENLTLLTSDKKLAQYGPMVRMI